MHQDLVEIQLDLRDLEVLVKLFHQLSLEYL
jgi:hypothetical protein